MKSLLHVVMLMAVSMLSILSCETETERAVKAMRCAEVKFPSHMYRILEDISLEEDMIPQRPLLTVFVDSSECNSCKIGKLYEYENFVKMHGGKVRIALILQPPRKDIDIITHLAAVQAEKVFLYVDTAGLFLKMNPAIPADWRFHSMLIGRDSKPVVIGDPTVFPKLNNLINRYLSNN